MPIAIWFWIAMFLWLLLGLWSGWVGPAEHRPYAIGGSVLLFILFLILGIAVFGGPIRG